MLEILFLSSAGRAENFTSPPSVLMILVYVMVKSPHLLVDTMYGWLYLLPYSISCLESSFILPYTVLTGVAAPSPEKKDVNQ